MKKIDKLQKLTEEMNKVMIGKEKEVELFTIALLFNGHILLESVPGTGKTMLAKTFSKLIEGSFSRIQFTPDVLPSDVTGIQFFNVKKQEFEFRLGPIVANIVLADEINRATPRTQSSLLEVMEERQVTIDGQTFPLRGPFMVVATQNPIESQQGTFPLPAAQMDRFFMKLSIGYPTLEEEKEMMKVHRSLIDKKEVDTVINQIELLELKQAVEQVAYTKDIEKYLLEIVRKTRDHEDIELGVSPRGTLALLWASQGKAFMEGRSFIVPNDIKYMAPFVLSHRIYLMMEASLTKRAEGVINEIIDSVPVPVEAGAY